MGGERREERGKEGERGEREEGERESKGPWCISSRANV